MTLYSSQTKTWPTTTLKCGSMCIFQPSFPFRWYRECKRLSRRYEVLSCNCGFAALLSKMIFNAEIVKSAKTPFIGVLLFSYWHMPSPTTDIMHSVKESALDSVWYKVRTRLEVELGWLIDHFCLRSFQHETIKWSNLSGQNNIISHNLSYYCQKILG